MKANKSGSPVALVTVMMFLFTGGFACSGPQSHAGSASGSSLGQTLQSIGEKSVQVAYDLSGVGLIAQPALPATEVAAEAPLSFSLDASTVTSGQCVGVWVCFVGMPGLAPTLETFALSTKAGAWTFYSDAACRNPTTTVVSGNSDGGDCADYQAYYANPKAGAVNDTLTAMDTGTLGYGPIAISLINGQSYYSSYMEGADSAPTPALPTDADPTPALPSQPATPATPATHS